MTTDEHLPDTMKPGPHPVRSSITMAGTVVVGARGLLLRDGDGICWRLEFVGETVPTAITGPVSIRGWLVGTDRIEVEYWEAQR